MKTLLSILSKIVLAIVGWFIIYDIFHQLLWIIRGSGVMPLKYFWEVPYYLLVDLIGGIYLYGMLAFALLFLMPRSTWKQLTAIGQDPASALHKVLKELGLLIAPFLLIAIAIIFFERRERGRVEKTMFYLIIPALVFILWSEIYL